eukprot:2776046-Pyramimonas_sp.AAC.1
MEVELHADPAIGTFGGAPYGATKRVRGAPTWACGRAEAEMGGRKEGGKEGGNEGNVSSKRGPNTTGWLGKTTPGGGNESTRKKEP